jgi:hypothetical protein
MKISILLLITAIILSIKINTQIIPKDIFLKRILQNEQNTNNKNYTTKEVTTNYGDKCIVRPCGDLVCADDPNAECQLVEGKETCVCKDGFITFNEDSPLRCCYKQKNGLLAILLEFIVSFGIGHFYVGNYLMGSIKAVIYFIFGVSALITLIGMITNKKRNERPFLLKVFSNVCMLSCCCIYIVWQIVDLILFNLSIHKDGNGANLYT